MSEVRQRAKVVVSARRGDLAKLQRALAASDCGRASVDFRRGPNDEYRPVMRAELEAKAKPAPKPKPAPQQPAAISLHRSRARTPRRRVCCGFRRSGDDGGASDDPPGPRPLPARRAGGRP
jgi:hypothetical protein